MSGTVIQDPVTGRILGSIPKTLWELYPTGRKHCSRCGCWRHLCDFSPYKHLVQSRCQACQRTLARQDHNPYPRTRMPREERLRRKRQEWAEYIAWVRADPERYQEYLETSRIRQHDRRRRAGVPQRSPKRKHDTSRELVDPSLFLEWFYWINPSVSDSDRRRIAIVRDADTRRPIPGKRLSLPLIDRVMTGAGAVDQFNVFYGHK